ncbi:recombinase family protein [Streptomyces cacaoi]|uniref:zinc finger domain-containing protein n=1 Tax=Streptomyces cacaoi TaxID=1898 RepID=UPI003748194A
MSKPAEPAAAVEQFDCPTCEVPAGSTCRIRGGKVAPKYHTPRFMLVPQLRAELEVRTPADCGPGHAWEMGPAIGAAVPEATTKPTRVGYARCSTAQQELQSQLDALSEAGCDPVFSEKISTRIKVRPEFVRAMDFAYTIKKVVPLVAGVGRDLGTSNPPARGYSGIVRARAGTGWGPPCRRGGVPVEIKASAAIVSSLPTRRSSGCRQV